MANEPKPTTPAPHITFEQFTESTVGAVLRAVEAQKLPHRPILIGIIWNPPFSTSVGNPPLEGAQSGTEAAAKRK